MCTKRSLVSESSQTTFTLIRGNLQVCIFMFLILYPYHEALPTNFTIITEGFFMLFLHMFCQSTPGFECCTTEGADQGPSATKWHSFCLRLADFRHSFCLRLAGFSSFQLAMISRVQSCLHCCIILFSAI